MHFLIKGQKEDSTEKCLVPGLGQEMITVSLEYLTMRGKKDVKNIYIYNYVSETTDASLHGLLSTHQKLGDLEINNNVD